MVGSGGFVGAVFRYGLSGFVQRSVPLATFPFGTLAVNMVGCLLIGVVIGLVDSRQLFGPEMRLFLLIGVLGGFTTYSTFGYESFSLLRDGDFLRSMANVCVHVVLGLALVWAGYSLATR